MGRYEVRVRHTEAERPWAIYDHALNAYCTLADEGRNLLPLEWYSRTGAETWLFQCRIAWEAGVVPMPANAGARKHYEVVQVNKRMVRRAYWA